jgi:hypothetical protein
MGGAGVEVCGAVLDPTVGDLQRERAMTDSPAQGSRGPEMENSEFARAIGRTLDTDDIRDLRTLERELGERWPDTREATVLTRIIQRKIARILTSN